MQVYFGELSTSSTKRAEKSLPPPGEASRFVHPVPDWHAVIVTAEGLRVMGIQVLHEACDIG